MINQVVLAGTLTQDPRLIERRPQYLELQLEVERLQRFGAPAEKCVVTVRTYNERQFGPITQYMTKGRSVLVQGHLREDGGALLVVAEGGIQFLDHGVTTRGFAETRAVVGAAS